MLERKELLMRKVACIQQRLTEEEHTNSSYTGLLKNIRSEHRELEENNGELYEQLSSLTQIMEELD